MKTTQIISAITLAAVSTASATAEVTIDNTGDAFVRLGDGQSQYNFGGSFDFSLAGTDEDPFTSHGFLRFDGDAIKTAMTDMYGPGFDIASATLSMWATGSNFFNAGSVEIFFSDDASWVEGENWSSSNDPNPSIPGSLTGDNYTDYISSLTSLGEFAVTEAGAFGDGNGVQVDFELTVASALTDAIDNGEEFSLYLAPTTTGLSVRYGASDSSWNPAPQLTFTNVPEPASAALLGLGTLLIARRRR